MVFDGGVDMVGFVFFLFLLWYVLLEWGCELGCWVKGWVLKVVFIVDVDDVIFDNIMDVLLFDMF